MILELAIAGAMYFCSAQAQQGFDMDDDDFAAYVQAHDNFRTEYGESLAKGCVAGGVKDGLKGGIPALCIGCATGAAAGLAIQMTFPSVPRRDDE